MREEEFEDFVKNRYEDQLRWYDRKAVACKRNHDVLQAITVACSVLAPILVLALDSGWKLLPAATAATVSVSVGIMAVFRIREKWINYRTTSESMRSEYWLYKTGSGPYAHEDGQHAFVERIERLLAGETRAWRAAHKKK